MKNESIWKDLKTNYETLTKDINCDVLIIGGGLSGLLSAYYLDNSNLKVVVVERGKIASGITARMTAKVTLLQDILSKISPKKLDLYIKSQIDGLKLLLQNIEDNNLKPNLEKSTSYLFTIKNSNLKKLSKIKKVLESNKIKVEEDTLTLANLDIKKALKVSNSYVINPLKYLDLLRKTFKNITIYENTNIVLVENINNNFLAKTSKGLKITSKKIIFATNYPYFLKPLFFPLKVRLEKSYIGCSESPLAKKNFNAINIDKEKHSIRFYDDKIIYLTASHSLASKVNDSLGFKKVLASDFLLEPLNLWSNHDIITNDNLPIVGEVFKNMYIITGYNTWGILSSHVASLMLASLILKKKRYLKYQELFNPRGKVSVQKFFNSSLNILESINGYLKGMILKNAMVLYSKDKALYIASDGKHYLVKRKCPHLKCNLLFNSYEKTWDCPCHGSRFDLEGNVIIGPSKEDIKVKSVK